MNSCETEVDLLAPYEETPVIYGILDYTADTQFVRINKTFLGEGDPSQYSVIKDSVEYPLDAVEAYIYKLTESGNLVDSFLLETVEIPSRDPGIFYDTDVLFYFTDEPILTESEISNPEDFIFELRALIRGNLYTASTQFPGLSESTIIAPVLNTPPQKIQFVLPSQIFTSYNFKFRTDQFSASYATRLRLNFDYETSDGTVVEGAFIDYNTGTFSNPELESGQEINVTVFGESWFAFLGTEFDLIPGLDEVRIENIEFLVTGATPDLNTYLEVAQPVSQFTPTLTSFTNISNGGIGIFASVATRQREAWLTEPTLLKFNESELTLPYNYCVQDWVGSNFVCN